MQTHVFKVYIFCLTSCILLKISTEIEVLEKINKEAVIADVIKNISRVNDVLEDLIHNYEKLKKIYKSQETFEENYSSNKEEAEISKDNGEKRSKNKQLTTRKPGMLATQMFVSEEKNNPDTSESDDEENTVDKSRTPKIELYQEGEKYVKTNDIDQEKSLSSDSDYSEESEEEDDIIEIPNKYYPKIGTFNKELTAKTDNVLLNIGTTKVHTQRKYEKENNKTESSVHQLSIKINNIGPRNTNKTHSIKKTIEPEEIIKYAPVNLTKQSLTKKRARTEFKFRTNATAKSALLDKKNNNDMHSYESIEDIKNLKKEQFKTRILRKAYGDACLKVVVKKCFKACKSALKSACVKYDCKSSFKSAFKDNAKTGCINQFREIPTNGTKLKAEVKLMHLTRNGYLGAACLPSPRTYSLQPIKARTNESKELNILRDRYERACQKTSSKKCKEACRYAIGETCKTYSCKKSKKDAFKKECKNECKKSYQYKKESSESDSSSKSDESGDSDSESKSLLKNDKKKKVTNVRKTRPQ